MPTLEEIREKLKQKAAQESSYDSEGLFQFWNLDVGKSAVVRFLPDGDKDNDFFWRERYTNKLPFDGVIGGDTTKTVFVNVPSMKTWGDKCPISEDVKPLWKTDKETAATYYHKLTYMFSGFVVKSDLSEENVPENPIRRFMINKTLFGTIKSALMDPDFGDYMPTDYEHGVDFKINKTQKGEYADYSTSAWARKERALTQEELDAIEKHGLANLYQYLPTKPDEEYQTAIWEMYQASRAGESYDPEKWAKYFRPFGVDAPKTDKADDAS